MLKWLDEAVLHNSIANHDLSTVTACKSSKDAWEALEKIHKAKSAARQISLMRELNTLQKLPRESVTVYLTRALALRDHLAAAGETVKDKQLSMYALAGLPSQYDVVATIFDFTEKELSLDDLLPRLVAVKQQSQPAYQPEEAAYEAYHQQGSRDTRTCAYCKRTGHLIRHCLQRKREEQARHAACAAMTNLAV